jgi:hypothetical protein
LSTSSVNRADTEAESLSTIEKTISLLGDPDGRNRAATVSGAPNAGNLDVAVVAK